MANAVPHLVVRDLALTLIVIATVLLAAMFFDAPLADQANPGLSPNPTKAPWYFMGIQEMLMHFHPVFALLVIPALLVLGLLLVPYFNYEADTTGVWFNSVLGRKLALVSILVGVVLTVAAVLLDEFVFSAAMDGPATVVYNGLVPFTLALIICIGYFLLIRKYFDATSNETIQALFTLLITSFVVLTIVGIWFRGPGMQLMWTP